MRHHPGRRSLRLLAVTLAALLLAAGVRADSPRLEPDIVVAADGSGDFRTVQSAVQSIPRENTERVVILLRDGTYEEKVRIEAACVTLRGESRAGARIEFYQPREEFAAQPDELGVGVVNIHADDVILEHLTVHNTFDEIGPHAMTVYGEGTRTIIQDADCLSMGADTVSLWARDDGMYYHARCKLTGSVDLLCPRGWCFVRDISFYEHKRGSATIWHDGDDYRDEKFVLRDCTFDGTEGFRLGRRHREAQFYLLDCTFGAAMAEDPIWRVTYPEEPWRDQPNLWGDRYYYYHCLREEGPQLDWYADNLAEAPAAPTPEEITPAWTFGGKWDPERTDPPKVVGVSRDTSSIVVEFSENVTVRGEPVLRLADGTTAQYAGGSGSTRLRFTGTSAAEPESLGLAGGKVFASLATAQPRFVVGGPLEIE